MFKLDPLTKRKFIRFSSFKRGYYSFIIVFIMIFLSLFAELWCTNRALLVKYNEKYYFPSYGEIIQGKTFGLGDDYTYEVNYRELKNKFDKENSDNFVILAPVPYSPLENDFTEQSPAKPNFSLRHFLGTDTGGRDVFARIVYGFRLGMLFASLLVLATYTIGLTIGCFMGYFAGWFDLIVQRIIEIWSNIPALYAIIIVGSLFVNRNLALLVFILTAFGWTGQTWQMRTLIYREKAADYVMAARSVGMGHLRIIFTQIMPNTISLLVTFIPFSVMGAFSSLSSLDFLGFGLPPPTPSWGELLMQGKGALLTAPWIAVSVVVAMVLLLSMISFIGEEIREAFDPKRHTTYE